jgi:mannose/cellobiose epimerase-like protein (N-acyl-D-glucosamine 2-epimerase family)
MTNCTGSRAKLATAHEKLLSWLRNHAYPLWANHGVDRATGGFIETLGQDGIGLPHPRRARVQPRQIYAFAAASGRGWDGNARAIVSRGHDYFVKYYRRPDGLFRTLAGLDGTPLDERAFLYDQAFALLGHSAAAIALGAAADFETRALDLRDAIAARFSTDTAFRSGETADGHFESNPHMHLLEACLAWAEIGRDPGWSEWARQIVDLALAKFVRPGNGALGEFFAANCQPAPGVEGRIIEPGHQFEWAWLLLRAQPLYPGPLRPTALRLIAIGEQFGVRNGVAINSLLDDFSVRDPNARFWPQTERLKAAVLAATLTGEETYWQMALAAATSLFPYLDTRVPGLWLDVQLPTGKLLDAPAPASSFYHLVGAIVALDTALKLP